MKISIQKIERSSTEKVFAGRRLAGYITEFKNAYTFRWADARGLDFHEDIRRSISQTVEERITLLHIVNRLKK